MDFRNWPRRFGPVGFTLMVWVLDQTESAFGSPEYARIDWEQLSQYLHVTVRAAQGIVARLLSERGIARHPDDPLSVRLDRDGIARAPVRCAIRKERKPPASESAEMHFREKPAALVRIGGAPVPASEIHFRQTETDSRLPETFCHWNWPCPFISSDLPPDKHLKPLETSISSSSVEEPTTTGSATDAAPPHAAPVPEPSPEQRIADDLPDRRDTAKASVRPSDRTERKRALPRPPQRRAKNGGDRPDRGSRCADYPAANEQNSTVLCAEIHCPPVVEQAILEACLGLADQTYFDGLWRDCRATADVTPEEVVWCIRDRVPVVRKTANRNALRFLWTAVVGICGTPATLGEVRRQIAAYQAQVAEEREQMERSVRWLYAEPDTSEEDKRTLLRDYPFLAGSS